MNNRILEAKEAGTANDLARNLQKDFAIVRATGVKRDRQIFLDAVLDNAHRGRTADDLKVQVYGKSGVLTCRVTTLKDKSGNTKVGHFWNTRVFVKQDEQWRCISWQIAQIPDD